MRGKEALAARAASMMDPKLVWINDEAIERLDASSISMGPPTEPAPPAASSRQDAIHFALAMNAINHQFWDVVDGRFERYAHNGLVGALAMRDGLARLLEDAGSFDALSQRLPLSAGDIQLWLGPIPDPAERGRALGEALGPAGRALAEALARDPSDGPAWGVERAEEIAVALPAGYRDPFLKKAQLALWMAKGMLEAGGWSAPEVEATVFADYQVPKVLRGLGILEYGEELARLVDAGELLESGGAMEVAIRAATIVACERIGKSKGVSEPALDFWLWSMRNAFEQLFHRTRGPMY